MNELITSRPHAIAAARGCSHCSPPDRGRATSICILVLAAVTAGCSSDKAVLGPTRSPQEETVPVHHAVVLGDSLAVSPSPPESFPAQLQKRLDAGGYRWKVVNAGVGGEVTAGGLRRLESVLTSETRILILELGANDGLRGVPIGTIERNLAAIIARAQERNIRVLLCGMETPPAHGWDYTVDFHRLFPALAARYSVPLVPFLLAGVALNPELNGGDGIHPNAAGARLIADTVWPYLESLVKREAGMTAR